MTVAGRDREDWGSHVLLLYRDERHRRASVAAWVKQGVDRREKILYAGTPGDDGLGSVEVTEAISVAQVSVLSVEDFFPPAGQTSLVHQALDEGYAGVRLAAWANAAISYLGVDGYREADEVLDELCTTLPVSAMCQYDATDPSAATMSAVIESHPDALQDVQMRLRHHGDRVSLAGEVDYGSADVLEHALHRIVELENVSDVTVDLSGLSFVDVVGCRALVSGTEVFRRAGGTVSYSGVSAHMGKVMRLLGMDRLPGMRLP